MQPRRSSSRNQSLCISDDSSSQARSIRGGDALPADDHVHCIGKEKRDSDSCLSEASADSLTSGVVISKDTQSRSKSRRKGRRTSLLISGPTSANRSKWHSKFQVQDVRTAELVDLMAEAVTSRLKGESEKLSELLQQFRDETTQKFSDLSTSLSTLSHCLGPVKSTGSRSAHWDTPRRDKESRSYQSHQGHEAANATLLQSISFSSTAASSHHLIGQQIVAGQRRKQPAQIVGHHSAATRVDTFQSDPGVAPSSLQNDVNPRSITTDNLPGELQMLQEFSRHSSEMTSESPDSSPSPRTDRSEQWNAVDECFSPTALRSMLRDVDFSWYRPGKKAAAAYKVSPGHQNFVTAYGMRPPNKLEPNCKPRQTGAERTPTYDNLYEVQRIQEKMLLETDAKTQERRSSYNSRSSSRPDVDLRAVRVSEQKDIVEYHSGQSEATSTSNSIFPDFTAQRLQNRHTTSASTPSNATETVPCCDSERFSLEALRRQRNTELSKIAFSPGDTLSDTFSAPDDEATPLPSGGRWQQSQRCLRLVLKVSLRLWGVVPWRQNCMISTCVQIAVVLAVSLIAIYPVVLLISNGSGDGPEEELPAQMLVCTTPFALAGMVGLASMRNQLAKELLWSFPGPLETYAMQHGFMEQWAWSSLRRFVLVFVVWASAVLVSMTNFVLAESDLMCGGRIDWLSFVCFFFGSGVFAALIFCQIHVFGMLEIMIDQFCIKFFEDPEVARGMMEWNLVQAIMRRVATAFDTCFVATQTMAQVTFVVSATYTVMADRLHSTNPQFHDARDCRIGHRAFALLPPVLLALGAWTVFSFGAAVTEKCSRVPAMINTMTFGDTERQSMVQYVMNSAAGLYIKEVRLTASVVMKLTYVTGLWVLAVLTDFIAKQPMDQ